MRSAAGIVVDAMPVIIRVEGRVAKAGDGAIIAPIIPPSTATTVTAHPPMI